ncbi:hypothetical protein OGAPHI_001377 [Ogataea philodendri]|uniref:Uncharacterized protein n=1 Tax=Ogataea philodendri TaxID=1378263 RepID=A0A9P8T7W5_9ASCO|nr:uncharacterized protein OGAPHI_001377 [Ogataea philodendri]KAH3669256.1 hypothetical protein OGAPHI_001377 [Ogataea philodendri]
MLATLDGVISTTRNVKIQLLAEPSAAALVLIASGAYSAGSSHGMASSPTAKKKLNANSITVATIPQAVLPLETVPARIAMQAPWPVAAKSINFLRPTRSSSQIGISDDAK